MAEHTLLSIFVALAVFAFYAKIRQSKSKLPYPPGPKPLPLLGNALDIPRSRGWLVYTEWEKIYNSPLLFASALGRHILVLNSLEDAATLLDDRAQLSSDRPAIPILNLMGWEKHTALMEYGNLWRFHRKLLHQHFRKDVLGQYHSVVMQKSNQVLHKLARTPEDFSQHLRVYAAANIMEILYGYNLASNDDELFALSDYALQQTSRAFTPGAFAVNNFPILQYLPRWFPGAGFHDWATETKKLSLQMRDTPFDFAKENWKNGVDQTSLVSQWLQDLEDNGKLNAEEEEIRRDVCVGIFSAALDTTHSALTALTLALALHPEVQKAAQKEIASVVGSRLPTPEDRPSLPYLEAIYRETLRWRPPLALTVPHTTIRDDVYKGYFIPSGTIILANVWAMCRNEDMYPDAEAFRPERFLNPDGTLATGHERILTYGFGRRVCAGKDLASTTFWLAMAHIIATFDITKAKDENGNDIHIEAVSSDEGITRPEPFQCTFVPRHALEPCL